MKLRELFVLSRISIRTVKMPGRTVKMPGVDIGVFVSAP